MRASPPHLVEHEARVDDAVYQVAVAERQKLEIRIGFQGKHLRRLFTGIGEQFFVIAQQGAPALPLKRFLCRQNYRVKPAPSLRGGDPPGTAERLGGIFNEPDVVLLGQGGEPWDVGSTAEDADTDDRPGVRTDRREQLMDQSCKAAAGRRQKPANPA